MADNNLTTKQLNLSKQYLNETTADVIFICGQDENKERIPAHKFVLFTNSDAFDRMFHGSLPEGNEIRIPDVSPNGFRTFLRYFYFDDYLLNIDVVDEVMHLAHQYMIEDYFDACCAFLKRKPQDNVAKHIIVGLELAITYELMELEIFFQKRIVLNDEEIFGSEYIRSISYGLLKCILQIYLYMRKQLLCNNVISEKMVFDACMGWAEEACIKANINPSMQNRRKKLGDCLGKIEFGAMNHNDLVSCIKPYANLFTSHEMERFMIMILAKRQMPNRNRMSRYNIGESIQCVDFMSWPYSEELHFNSRTRILLGGIDVTPIYHTGRGNILDRVMVRIFKTAEAEDRQKSDKILLLRQIFHIRDYGSPTSRHQSSTKLMFTEAVLIEPNSNYKIQLDFVRTEMGPRYHYHSIIPKDYNLFRILPQTNSNVVTAFIYNRVTHLKSNMIDVVV